MSKVVRNIWELQTIMWYHSNISFQVSNGNIHQHEEEDLTVTIHWKFAVGQNGLPAAYSCFSRDKSNVYYRMMGSPNFNGLGLYVTHGIGLG